MNAVTRLCLGGGPIFRGESQTATLRPVARILPPDDGETFAESLDGEFSLLA